MVDFSPLAWAFLAIAAASAAFLVASLVRLRAVAPGPAVVGAAAPAAADAPPSTEPAAPDAATAGGADPADASPEEPRKEE